MQIKKSVCAMGVMSGLLLGLAPAAHATTVATPPASYQYDFKTYFDESTILNPFDTASYTVPVATLTVTDIAGGVQLSLKANSTAFPAKTSAGNYIEELWLDGGNGTLKLTSTNTSLVSGSGYKILPVIPKLGYSYNWDIDFKAATFAEGETTTMTILGTGINARSFVNGGLPMITLGNVGSPLANLSGMTYFVASHPTCVPEAGSVAMASLGLAGLGFWSRRKKA